MLGLGAAYGDELIPLVKGNKIRNSIIILEPSDAFVHDEICGVRCEYKKPDISGTIPFEDETFDLITCFGVLHHIPNVSYVMRECYRVLRKGGEMALREPINSMGDWRKPREGTTKYERGIPIDIFRKIIHESGFTVISEILCDFPVIPKVSHKIGVKPYNTKFFVYFDRLLSFLFKWNITYYRDSFFKKLAPASIAYVLKKIKNKEGK